MELRHIRYFLALAEAGNFTRAAEGLGIGQPPLSQQIRALEDEIGARLFHRVPHGAELTEAGRAFLAKVRDLPQQAGLAVEAARRADRGELGTLSLGFTGTAALNPAVPRLIRTFRRARPEVTLRLTESNSLLLRRDLLAGKVDVAVLRPAADDPPEIRTRKLLDEPLLVALPRDHDPAPGASEIALAALAAMPLILTPRELGISLHDSALAACRAAGFEPRPGQIAPQIASILSLVSAEMGFALVPESMRQLAIETVVYKRLAGASVRVDLALATQRGPLSPVARAFLDLVSPAEGAAATGQG
ncbi:LysR substrate-binding domain-containing protein [Frigidibacter sp. MR17.14]|uniref:LysR substrate-binding domain-containing protein n=1 Tax=Frigidibacter sp. MR17.14 TaxID=3126509 RepID=UPI0030131A86